MTKKKLSKAQRERKKIERTQIITQHIENDERCPLYVSPYRKFNDDQFLEYDIENNCRNPLFDENKYYHSAKIQDEFLSLLNDGRSSEHKISIIDDAIREIDNKFRNCDIRGVNSAKYRLLKRLLIRKRSELSCVNSEKIITDYFKRN